MSRRCFVGLSSALVCLGVLASCGPRVVGWGVILWGDPTGLAKPGAVVGIIQHSVVSHSVIVSLPSKGQPVELPEAHVQSFPNRSAAAAFSATMEPYATTWAYSTKEDAPPLPIREEARADAVVAYRLQPQQLLKVISRGANKEAVGQYLDYWYEVVTDDGHQGWCYGYYLKVFTTEGDPVAEAQRLQKEDPLLDSILGNTWRPDYYPDMISRSMIDLTRFREDIGFFPDRSQNLIRIVLPEYSLDFHYTRVEKLAQGTYQAVGADLRITVLDTGRIALSYSYKSQPVETVFVLLSDDVTDIVAKEQARRQDLYTAFVASGTRLVSSAYGTVELSDGMKFSWQGLGKLVPAVVGASAQDQGTVDFRYHLAKALQGSYDGVLTFLFDDPSGGFGSPLSPTSVRGAAQQGATQGVSFLYKSVDGGIRFTSLGEESFKDLYVMRPAISPVVIFFTQSGT